jgi:hypothetical protein
VLNTWDTPPRPVRLGTMWSGTLDWTIQFTQPSPENTDPGYYGSFVITQLPDPVVFDYQGDSYVLNSSLSRDAGVLYGEGGFGSSVAMPYLQLAAVPEAGTMTAGLLAVAVLGLEIVRKASRSRRPRTMKGS